MPRFRWLLVAVLALLVVLALFGLPLWGRAALRLLPADLGLRAERVGGPLWAPRLSGVQLQMPGLTAKADRGSVSLAGLDWRNHRVRLNVSLENAVVDADLKKLFGGPHRASAWTVLPGRLNLQNVRLNLNGRGLALPDAEVRVSGEGDRLQLLATTREGGLRANIQLDPQSPQLSGTADVVADATLINHFWKGAVKGGLFTGRYELGPELKGDLKLSGGRLVVPNTDFLRVHDISGVVTQRGNLITTTLNGLALGGTVSAQGRVDLDAHQWTVSAKADPTVQGLAAALGTGGKGQLHLTANAGGWQSVDVRVSGGGSGEIAGVPFQNLDLKYVYGKDKSNRLQLTSALSALGERQRLSLDWEIGVEGTGGLKGDLLGQPLDLTANLAGNRVAVTGRALGGPASARYDFASHSLKASLSPALNGLKAQLSASGQTNDLALTVDHLKAGPLRFSGAGRLDARGEHLNLTSPDGGRLTLDLDHKFQGTWSVQGLSASGLTLDGAGQLDARQARLRGTLAAQLPGDSDRLEGPLNLDLKAKSGSWNTGHGLLSWQDRTLRARLDALKLEGLSTSGNLRAELGSAGLPQVYGRLTAAGSPGSLTLNAQGDRVALDGTLRGLRVTGQTRLVEGFPTQLSAAGGAVQAQLSVAQGIDLTLRTGDETASALIEGKRVTASGRVDLSALAPLVGLPDLRGRLELLPGVDGSVNARLTGSSSGAAVSAAGQLYPEVALSGQLTASGQTLKVTVSGPYDRLGFTATGRTQPLSASGVALPAQPLELHGTLTPNLSAVGQLGGVALRFADGQLHAQGSLNFLAQGQPGQLQLNATYGPGWSGEVSASGSAAGYTVQLSGPWRALRLTASGPEGLRARGTLDASTRRYTAQLEGRVQGLYVTGRVQGQDLNFSVDALASDGAGGTARLRGSDLQNLELDAAGLSIAGQTLHGQLTSRAGRLNGSLRAGPLNIVARDGLLTVQGEWNGTRIDGSARLTLPSSLADVQLRASGVWGSAVLSGSGQKLSGRLDLAEQRSVVGGLPLLLPAQSLPLRASLQPLSLSAGGLSYAGGQWSGQADLRYLAPSVGRLTLLGQGGQLSARLSGPARGTVSLLPQLGGRLTIDLAPFVGLLPDPLREATQPGALQLELAPSSLHASLLGTRYVGEALTLDARASWQGGLRASGLLSQPGTRLPFDFDGQNLTVRGARLDGRALRPFLAGAEGGLSLDLKLPGLDWQRGSGLADVNLSAQGQQARGWLRLAGGQLDADLSSTLGGRALTLRGPLLPRAAAELRLDGVRGQLRGDPEQGLTLQAAGNFEGRELSLSAAYRQQALQLAASVAGAQIAGQAVSGADGWRGSLSLNAPDLRALTGTAGRLSGSLAGSLKAASGSFSGELGGAQLTLPVRWDGRALSLNAAAASTDFARGQLSGEVYPRLKLTGRAILTDYLPGDYALSASGPLSAPSLRAEGLLSATPRGLQAAGSRVTARLSGRDYLIEVSGERLSGQARGQLGSGALAGLQTARFNLHTRYLLDGGEALSPDGVIGWNARTGFLGDLRLRGQAAGQALDLKLSGDGPLKVVGQVGPGRVAGTLGARLPLAPRGVLLVSEVDLGALWGRPGQLGASGRLTLDGSWSAPHATVAGTLNDAGGDLSGQLAGEYAAGRANVQLDGQQLKARAQLQGGRVEAEVQAQGARLARLLPADWHISRLDLSGAARLSGGGPAGWQLSARDLDLRGEQREAGPFSARGTLTYSQQALTGQLSVSALGGSLVAAGALPEGMQLAVTRLDLGRLPGAQPGLGELNGVLKLTGEARDPALAGRLNLSRPELAATLDLTGRLSAPAAHLSANLRGAYSGQLYADLRHIRLSPPAAELRLYGTATQGANRLDLDLAGSWPRLAGEARAQLAALQDPVTLKGDGQGGYALDAGRGGGGQITLGGPELIPQLNAELRLNPLALAGAQGSGTLTVTAAGPLNAPTLTVNGQLRGVTRSGVELGDLSLTGGGPLNALSAELRQSGLGGAGGVVARYTDGAATIDGLRARLAGSTVSASGMAGANGVKATLETSGSVSGTLKASYLGGALEASGELSAGGANLGFRLAADQQHGWSGGGQLSGLPAALVTRDLTLKASGAFASPQLTGDLGLLGANASLKASPQGATLTLKDGAGVQADGTLTLAAQSLGGQLRLSRQEGSLRLNLAGTPAEPKADLNATLGGWTAAGQLGLKAGQLAVGDGERSGNLSYAGGRLRVNLPGLDLARLGLLSIKGRLSAAGDLALDRSSGALSLQAQGLSTGGTLPLLDLPLTGDVQADVTAVGGTLSGHVALSHPNGTLRASLNYRQTLSGSLRASLSQGGGTLGANLLLDAGSVRGSVNAQRLPLTMMGLTERLSGQLDLTGQDFSVQASLTGELGRAQAQGGGSLADVNPTLSRLLGLPESGSGYRVDARLSGLDLHALKLGPYLTGNAVASATITDGGTTFVARADDLKAAGEALPTRVEGNSDGTQWRLRGNVGDSQLSGGVQAGVLTGRLNLVALPLSNLIAALAGPLPGSALVTGLARFEVPLADPLSGSADVVAERIGVRGGGQQLTGSGVLAYRDRELSSLNLQLAGAGTWNVQGQYTRDKVDLSAVLSGTDFTPLLSLIPALGGSQPSLAGDLNLRVLGSYDAPQATLSASRFRGRLNEITLNDLSVQGQLAAGRLSAQGSLNVSGAVASQARFSASGLLENGALSGAEVRLNGPLAIRQVGRLSAVSALVRQEGGAWTLDASATQGGSARVTGTLAPTVDLQVSARGFAPQLAFIFGRETSIDGDLSVTERGPDYLVGGALTLNRLVLGSVATPPGTEQAQTAATTGDSSDAAAQGFVSPLPPELTTFPSKNGEKPVNPLLSRIVLDNIPVRLPNGARIDENLIRADLTGALTLSGRVSDLRISGSASALRGSVFLRENEFAIKAGSATFDGTSAFPSFSVQAEGLVPDGGASVGVGVDLAGSFPYDSAGKRALKLDTTVHCTANCLANGHDYTASNPNAQAQLYALVALGTPDLATLPNDLGGLGASALRTALSVFVLGQVERGLAQAFGLDSFRIRTSLLGSGGTETGDATEFSVGSYLTRELFLQYTIGLSGRGLINATYTTPDSRFTFRVSSPLDGLNLTTLRPSFSLGYNFTPLSSATLGVENSQSGTTFKLGYALKF